LESGIKEISRYTDYKTAACWQSRESAHSDILLSLAEKTRCGSRGRQSSSAGSRASEAVLPVPLARLGARAGPGC